MKVNPEIGIHKPELELLNHIDTRQGASVVILERVLYAHILVYV
jgi:hypothetical protein